MHDEARVFPLWNFTRKPMGGGGGGDALIYVYLFQVCEHQPYRENAKIYIYDSLKRKTVAPGPGAPSHARTRLQFFFKHILSRNAPDRPDKHAAPHQTAKNNQRPEGFFTTSVVETRRSFLFVFSRMSQI